jgi:hypothetical protein
MRVPGDDVSGQGEHVSAAMVELLVNVALEALPDLHLHAVLEGSISDVQAVLADVNSVVMEVPNLTSVRPSMDIDAILFLYTKKKEFLGPSEPKKKKKGMSKKN